MAKLVGNKFAWVIRNFSSLQCEICYSVPVVIGDCKWRLLAYPKGDNCDYLSLFLEVADFKSLPSGWRKYVKLKLTIVRQVSEKRSIVKETHRWFDLEVFGWGFVYMHPLTKLHDENEGFLVNGELMITAEVDVLEVIDTSDESEEASELLKEMKLDDGAVSCELLNQSQQVKESIDVNGFQVPPSQVKRSLDYIFVRCICLQVESVRCIFERHPDIALEFRARNQHLRKACMNFLLSLVETLCQPLQELSNEDLVEADIALTYVKDAGFKVDWLEEKLEELKDKKEKEQFGLARLQDTKETLLELKQKSAEVNALVEKEKAELASTRNPLSFDDVV